MEANEEDACCLYLRYRKEIKRYPDLIAAALVYLVIPDNRPDLTIVDVASKLMIPVSDLNRGVQRIKRLGFAAQDPLLSQGHSNEQMLSHRVNILIDQLTTKVYSIMLRPSRQNDNDDPPFIPGHIRQRFKHLAQGIVALADKNGLTHGRHFKLLSTASMAIAACAMTRSTCCTLHQYQQLADYIGCSRTGLQKRYNELLKMLLERARLLFGRYASSSRSSNPNSISLEVLEEIINDDDNTRRYLSRIQKAKGINDATAPPSFKKSEQARKYQDKLIQAARGLQLYGNTIDHDTIKPEIRLTAILLEQGVPEDEIRTMKPSDLPLRALQILKPKPRHDLNDINLSDKDLSEQEMNEYLVDAFRNQP